jgi:hypothetical protein
MEFGKAQIVAAIKKKNFAMAMIRYLVLKISADTIKQSLRGSTDLAKYVTRNPECRGGFETRPYWMLVFTGMTHSSSVCDMY